MKKLTVDYQIEYDIILILICLKFMVVLDGEVAVPCSLQPAIAGSNSMMRPISVSPA
jgi:hypothetical protein